MKDILLDISGDILLKETGDFQFTDSIVQAISIRLKWFLNEWKLGPDLGIPYYEEFFVKNPSTTLLEDRILEAIYDVDEVEEVEDMTLTIDKAKRVLKVWFKVKSSETYKEGTVVLNV